MGRDATLALSTPTKKACAALLRQYPLTAKERQDLAPPTGKKDTSTNRNLDIYFKPLKNINQIYGLWTSNILYTHVLAKKRD